MVYCSLTEVQSWERQQSCQNLVSFINNNPTFLHTITTGDETWYFLHDPQTKLDPTGCKSPSSPQKMKCLQERWCLRCFLTAEVSYTRNSFLRQLPLIKNGTPKDYVVYEAIYQKRVDMRVLIPGSMTMLWYITHPRSAGTDETWHCCATMRTIFSRHCPTWHFFCSYKWSKCYCHHFSNAEDVKAMTTVALHLTKTGAFQNCFQDLCAHRQRCIKADRNYLEWQTLYYSYWARSY